MAQAQSILLGEAKAAGAGGARTFAFGGVSDGGTTYTGFAQTNFSAPGAGADEATFYALFLTLTWNMPVRLRLTPHLDARPSTENNGVFTFAMLRPKIDLPAVSVGLETRTFELPLAVRTLESGVETARNALVGSRLRLELATEGPIGAGVLILDGAELELELAQENKPQEGP